MFSMMKHNVLVVIWVLVVTVASLAPPMYTFSEFVYTKIHAQQLIKVKKDLPGPKNQISARSIEELMARINKQPHILGAWVSKLSYTRDENPVIWYHANSAQITEVMRKLDQNIKAGRGVSSADIEQSTARSMLSTNEAKTGQVSCGALNETNLLKLAPGLSAVAVGVCRATIPPNDNSVNLAVVIVTDLNMNAMNDQSAVDIRRMILQLQLDIYNRDYLGNEIWDHGHH